MEEDLKNIEEFLSKRTLDEIDKFLFDKYIKSMEKVLKAYKQDEKMIDDMAEYVSTKNYEDDICEFRLDVKGRFHKHCYKGECKDCIKEYFRKKVETNE